MLNITVAGQEKEWSVSMMVWWAGRIISITLKLEDYLEEGCQGRRENYLNEIDYRVELISCLKERILLPPIPSSATILAS
jgi:hypothetical protein